MIKVKQHNGYLSAVKYLKIKNHKKENSVLYAFTKSDLQRDINNHWDENYKIKKIL